MSTQISKSGFEMPSDGWYAIESPGEHPNPTAGLVQVIDSTAVNSMVREFNGEADAFVENTGGRWPGMLIDHEHFKHDTDKETIAYGWLMRLQNRKGTLYGQIKWTATGQASVEGGDYRFFSTEYDPSDVVVLNSATPKRVRPMKLDGLTLTNQPNNPGLPITNRAAPAVPPIPKVSPHLIAAQNQQDKELEPLTTWLQKVATVHAEGRKALGKSIGGNFGINEAWQHTMRLYPELHAAAHGLVSAPPPDNDDAGDVQLAGQQLAEVANRISQLAKCALPSAYLIAGEKFPKLFNRLKPAAQRITNRQKLDNNPKALKDAAVKIFNRQVQAEIKETGHPYSVVFSRVMNREPVIGRFASGLIPPADVLVNHPDVWLRLQVEND